jgi:hypothetical protein
MSEDSVKRVFISYKSEYRDFARELKAELERCGYEVWIDFEQIRDGQPFVRELDKGLKSSYALVGIVTPEAIKSSWVQWEWEYALIKEIPMIPVLYKVTNDIPYPYITFNIIDFTREELHDFGKVCKAVLNQKNPEITGVKEPSKQSKTEIDNREAMLNMVKEFWIEGVLRRVNPLKEHLDTSMRLRADAIVKDMQGFVLETPSIKAIYDLYTDAEERLLILGQPGSGKTFTMLQLTEVLIFVAQNNPKVPIPVIFNLASWSERRKPIAKWIVGELRSMYQVPTQIAEKWLENREISLMLDGLDEVVESYRGECVDALNHFRKEHAFIDMLVCSRSEDYEKLKLQLDVDAAIEIQALSSEQIDDYLVQNNLLSLQKLITEDEILQEFSQSPFLLTTMGYAYEDASEQVIKRYSTFEARRSHLFDTYIEKRIRDEPHHEYSLLKTRQYLSWLAGKMKQQGLSIFLIERMQPRSLLSEQQYFVWQWLSRSILVIVLSLFAIGSLTAVYTANPERQLPLPIIVVAALTIATIMWSACEDSLPTMQRIIPDSTMATILCFFALYFVTDLPLYIVIGGSLAAGTIGLLGPWLAIRVDLGGSAQRNEQLEQALEIPTPEILRWDWSLARKGFLMGLIFTPLVALVLALLFDFRQNFVWVAAIMIPLAISGGLSGDYMIGATAHPNQGIWTSLERARQMFMIVGISAAIISLFGGLFLNLSLSRLILFVIFQALLTGGTSAFVWGGHNVLRHMILRIILRRDKKTPLNYANFLDYTTYSTILTRRVGGGYIFIHRYLLEHFAGLYQQDID